MSDRARLGEQSRVFFEEIWRQPDPWALASSAFERERYARLIGVLDDHRYGRVLEIGCGAGRFTRMLSTLAERIVALDVSPTAIDRARSGLVPDGVEFRAINVLDFDPRAEGPWDLVVMSETIYYLGWLYSLFDVGWLCSELLAATKAGGRLLLANTTGEVGDSLVLPWLIRSYRDLCLNVGYALEHETTFRGTKDDTPIDVLISVLRRPVSSLSVD